jgi:putative ABC transport system substrate-binding protein
MKVAGGQASVVSENAGVKSMGGKVFVWLLTTFILPTVSLAEAQQRAKFYRIGYLGGGVGVDEREKTLRQALQELGYNEGQNIVIEWRFAKGDEDRLPELAAELVRLKPDVIVTTGTQPARALKDATTTIPIVVASAGDLVGRGLVASLARPGGNITGSTSIAPDLNGKRLELLKEIVPRASRVAFLYQPHEKDELRELEIAARALGLRVQQLEVKQASQFQSAYGAMTRERADALIISRNPFTNSHRRSLIDLAAKHRLPAMCDGTEWTNAGCLISYSPNRTEGSRRAAIFVDKILKGAKPADLPVEQPMRFELVINLKAAKQLGLTIPPNVLARADKVIK